MSYLRNAWYVAALAREIQGEAMLSRKLLGEGVLIYRLKSGEFTALRDRCPHRFVPLHMGKRVEDDVVCPYHALRFNASGKCVHNPHGNQSIPEAARVHCYPLVERYGLLWIWMGEPSRANPADIMDCSKIGERHPDGVGYGTMHFDSNYVLLVENILDLSHADHVHSPIINTQGQLSKQVPKLQATERTIMTRWDWKQTPAQLVVASFLPEPNAEARQFAEAHWHAPSSMLVSVGAMQGEGVNEVLRQTWDFHFLTPETEHSTHYFFVTCDNWKEADAEHIKMKLGGMLAAFEFEDGPIVAAIENEMAGEDFWSLKPVLLTSDPGPIRARRLLDKLIRDENATPQTVAAS
jgi:phenylpropionate dioxygenase-like ring-hydroxylating dioxygenase large terminal subunit